MNIIVAAQLNAPISMNFIFVRVLSLNMLIYFVLEIIRMLVGVFVNTFWGCHFESFSHKFVSIF